eukprot:scaffold365819_cov301-Cyclotella_meneghiniana.AAC.1
MGTKISSGAYQSTFVWDHGKNERTFQHGVDCLPTLQVNVGNSYYKAFCTQLSKSLAAVDAHVAKDLFHNCIITELLLGKNKKKKGTS